ncbi:MAG TPA: aspartate kinase [Bacteroidales bacterium]|nr:aspartate kinase [Bacteroidales bacterium]
MLTVEKIGGTSMSQFGDVVKNIIIGSRKEGDYYNRIMVVSAYNNVTNWLLEHKKTKEPGIYARFAEGRDYNEALADLLKKLIEINHSFENIGLDLKAADHFISTRIVQTRNYLNSLADVLATGYVSRQSILLAAREILASIGEAHSGFNSVNILNNRGVNAKFIDLCGFNDPEYLTIDERIHKAFQGIDFSKVLCIATGYTKGTEGIMREFDRGYSEVTFSKIAVEVKADEAIIHKEFHLSSADPKIVGVEKSIPVGFTNYNVADQLADVGMEAIHPKASKPIEIAGINIRIKNTFEPEHPGTLISKDYISKESKIEIVTGSDKVTAIEVHDPFMVGEVGFDYAIMEFFKKYNISYILKSSNANSITTVIWQDEVYPEFIADLQKSFHKITVKNVALVCTLGTNIAKPGILAKATTALSQNNINIDCISQSLSQVSIQFVIEREHYNKAIAALNDALCVKNN